jgi:hypothetical protein
LEFNNINQRLSVEYVTSIQTKKRGVMVFNTTFNNISVISWHSVLQLEEIAVPGENH